MKTINEDTTLRCKNKTFQSVEVDGVNFWVDKEATIFTGMYRIDGGADTGENPIDKHCGENYTPRLSMHPKYPYWLIVAQSQPKLEGIHVISLDSYVEKLAMNELKNRWSHLYTFGYPKRPFPTNYENDLNNVLLGYYKLSNPNQYTQQDIEKAYKMGYEDRDKDIGYGSNLAYCKEQINSISVIEVDEQFNIISYE